MSFIIFPGVITPPLTPGAVPYGTGSTVLMSAQGTAGQALVSTGAGAPIWASAVPSSTNIGGGVAGDLPYQSAPSTTTFRNLVPGAVVYGDASAPNYTAVGTAGQVLQSNATGAPSWTTNISGNAANVTGTVAVANGGTGLATLTAENVILGDGTNNVKFVAPGSSGNVLTSNGTTWTSAAAAGGLTLIATATANNSATVDFTSGIGASYSYYVVVFYGVTPATDDTELRARFRINGTFQTSNYSSKNIYSYTGSTTVTSDNETTGMTLTRYRLSDVAARTGSGQILFGNVTSTTEYKTANAQVSGFSPVGFGTDVISANICSGYYVGGTQAMDGIRFYMSSGNITKGTFKLYGYQ